MKIKHLLVAVACLSLVGFVFTERALAQIEKKEKYPLVFVNPTDQPLLVWVDSDRRSQQCAYQGQNTLQFKQGTSGFGNVYAQWVDPASCRGEPVVYSTNYQSAPTVGADNPTNPITVTATGNCNLSSQNPKMCQPSGAVPTLHVQNSQ